MVCGRITLPCGARAWVCVSASAWAAYSVLKGKNMENVISLSRAKIARNGKECEHKNIIVDEELAEVECAKCGERLNPSLVLARFAREESRWGNNLIALREAQEALKEKRRCKCQHCGKFTNIKI